MPLDLGDANLFPRPLSAAVSSLASSGVTLVPRFPDIDAAPGPDVIAFLELALASSAFDSFPSPAVIDLAKSSVVWNALGRSTNPSSLRRALLRGRVRLQGTDGVRGPVSLSSGGNPVLRFGRTGEVSPAFIRVLCLAFGRLVRDAGVASLGDKVVLANDGRDAATGWKLVTAAKEGFAAAGLVVLDLGVAPTPAVPFACARAGLRLGASITASHNPANQNGIKFFIDGFKMLPEGPLGDFALSAVACSVSSETVVLSVKPSVEDGSALLDDFAAFIVSNLPPGAIASLGNLDILVDPANGACVETAKSVFSRLEIPVTFINDAPTGANINQGGGVAELEGRSHISAAEAFASPSLSSIAALLARVRRTGRTAYALVLDGDGDRGFLAVSSDGETAHVVDGDAESFILAGYMCESEIIPDALAPEYKFVGTVESDLELFRAVRDRLGLSTVIVCVGDKWLVAPYRSGGFLAVGQEFSGHLLWPAGATAMSGEVKSVLSGNGILTGLAALAAAARMEFSPAELARPFLRGAFVTRYTYNVNKALFFPGSPAWDADLACISAALAAARHVDFASWRVIEMSDEPDMLYVGLEDSAGTLVGAVFVRNSGTENKTCVYARGGKSLEPLLGQLCDALWRSHRQTLKDHTDLFFKVESAILTALASAPLSRDALYSAVSSALAGEAAPETPSRRGLTNLSDTGVSHNSSFIIQHSSLTPGTVPGPHDANSPVSSLPSEKLTPETLDAVLYGMRKESLVSFSSNTYSLLA